jgi:hypothetical protein
VAATLVGAWRRPADDRARAAVAPTRRAAKTGKLWGAVYDPTSAARPDPAIAPPPLRSGRVPRLPLALIAVILAVIVVEVSILAARGSHPSGLADKALTSAQLRSQLLALSDLPAGWSLNSGGEGISHTLMASTCLTHVADALNVAARADVDYQGTLSGLPELAESVIDVPGHGSQIFAAATAGLAGCHVQLAWSGRALSGVVDVLSFPQEGQQSAAYQLGLSPVGGQTASPVGIDLAIIQIGDTIAVVDYASSGSPNVATFQSLAAHVSLNLG